MQNNDHLPAESHNTPTADAVLLARAAATWPGMGRYLSDMRLSIGLAFDSDRGVMVPRMTVVIEIKGENDERIGCCTE